MEKQSFKNNSGFSLLEVTIVLFVIVIILSIFSFNPINSYSKYKERIAVNEIVSDIYMIQTKSLNDNKSNFIQFYEKENKYRLFYDGREVIKSVGSNGITGTGTRSLTFRYKEGNVNIANTILVMFEHSKYEIIIHLETGYVTLNEK